MRRFTYLLFGFCACFAGVMTYSVKQSVVGLEGDYRKTTHEIFQLEESMRILGAEWSYLTEPERLQLLTEKYLSAGPATGVSLVAMKDIPSRDYNSREPIIKLASASGDR